MKQVVFLNRKGGVGKSTCAAEFVLSLRRSGIKCQFIDLDQQQGSIIEENEEPDAQICVLDTPGALDDDLATWIHDSDVVCVCSKPSPLDIASTDLMIDSFKANKKTGAKLVIIIAMFTRWTNSAAFLEWVKEAINDIDGATYTTLLQSEMFPQAASQEQSVIEYAPRSTAAQSALAMVNTIRQAAGLENE